jgi:mRNA interferase RelE/StbE
MLVITYSHQARKALKRIPKKQALQILARIEKVAENPSRTDLDIKKLKGRDGYRLRVGEYRVLYSEDGVILSIERIGPRGNVYS